MKLAIAGPAELAGLRPLLHPDAARTARLPAAPHGHGITQLVTGLVERGHEVVLVTLSRDVTDERILEGPNLRLRIGSYRPRHRARDAFRAERAYISDALQREQPELIHAQWTYEYALGALSTDLPTLISIRDWAPNVMWHFRRPYWVVRFLMNARTLQRGRHFTASSPFIQRRTERLIRRPVALIPNFVLDSLFYDHERAFSGDSAVLLAVNNGFSRWKNVQRLLEAFPQILADHPDATLQLVGNDYEEGGAAHGWAADRGLDRGVSFVGPRSHAEVISLMREADLFVHPSLQESFGNVLAEAMAQRLPVVAGESSGAAPWVTGGGVAGALTDVTSPAAIADAILSLLQSPAAWEEASRSAFTHVWSNFRFSRIVGDYEHQYARVLAATNEAAVAPAATRTEGGADG